MSAPKAFLKVGGVSIIERELGAVRPLFEEVIIVANDTGPYSGFGVRVVQDAERVPGTSPVPRITCFQPPAPAYMVLMYSGLNRWRH